MSGAMSIRSLDNAITKLEIHKSNMQSKSYADSAVKILQDVDKHIGKTLSIDFKVNDTDLNQLKGLKIRICKIAEFAAQSNLDHNLNKHCNKTLEKIDLITNYCTSDDVHYKASLKTKLINSVRSDIIEYNIDWNKVKNNPLTHAEWPEFKSKTADYLTKTEAEYIWKKLITGIIQVKECIENNKTYKDISIFYEEIAALLSEKGLLNPRKDKLGVALWSGGYDVSLFAQKNGFATLENTIAGSIFDNLVLIDTWKPLGLLWNALSNHYVSNIDKDVHVFFRVHDPLSVLERVEIPSLALKKNTTFIFHPLYNSADGNEFLDMQEIKIKIDSSKKPHIVLKNFLVQACKKQLEIDKNYALYEKNLIAINNMKLD
jgi:hypothetical protein